MSHPKTAEPSETPTVELHLRDLEDRPVTVRLDEHQARQVLEQCIHTFGWHATNNPLTENFFRSFSTAMNIADKIEGGA